jgi:hypothetical protein
MIEYTKKLKANLGTAHEELFRATASTPPRETPRGKTV